MFKKFLVILSSILLVAGLFACRNNAEVEELKRQVEELKQQAEEKKEEKSEEVVGTVENSYKNTLQEETELDKNRMESSVEGKYTSLLKKIYQSIKNKTEFDFGWPYMWEDGKFGEAARGISPDWIEESKLECKVDDKGNLWMKTENGGNWEELTGEKESVEILFKDGTTENYGVGYDTNNNRPFFTKQFGWGNLETEISKEEYEAKIEEYYNIIDAWE